MQNLQPPFLVVRPGQSIWVETRAPRDCATTLQAFQSGCLSETWWYDAAGGAWPVVEAKLKDRPSLVDRVLPWRRVAVELHFGPRAEANVSEVLSRIGEVLHSDNEFCAHLKTSMADIWAQFSNARTTADLIAVANRHL